MIPARRISLSATDSIRSLLLRAERANQSNDLRATERELRAFLHADPANHSVTAALRTIQRRLAVITTRSRLPTVIG